MTDDQPHSPYGLENHGLRNLGAVHWNLSQAVLTEHTIRKSEGVLSSHGAMVVETGQHTGRSANDKFVVRDESTENEIWWGKVNVPYEPARFEALFARMVCSVSTAWDRFQWTAPRLRRPWFSRP